MRGRTVRRLAGSGIAIAAVLSSAGCQGTSSSADSSILVRAPGRVPSSAPSASASPQHRHAVVGLGTRRPSVFRVAQAFLGKSWHPGCPVPPSALRGVTLRYWGFDHRRHLGTLVVNASALHTIQAAFHELLAAHFPIRRMTPMSAYGGSDNRSMAHDNTSGFNCRFAVANGPRTWSEHAFGEAVDLDPLENPYRFDGKILPPAGATYANRGNVRPGMVVADGVAVRSFDALGWGWGGRWSSTPDFQHFSVNGR